VGGGPFYERGEAWIIFVDRFCGYCFNLYYRICKCGEYIRQNRPALGIDAALDEIAKNKSILYDPEVVDACLQIFNEKGFKLVD